VFAKSEHAAMQMTNDFYVICPRCDAVPNRTLLFMVATAIFLPDCCA